nr:hypothetical protein [uncultured Mediterranean phage uvMED]
MGLFDKIGDVFEDVKDAVVDAAPVLLPIALSYFAPGMSLVGRQALGAGIGTLLKGGKPEDALKSAAIGGALGAVQGGIGGLMQGGGGFTKGLQRSFQGTQDTGIFGRPLRDSAAGGDRTFRESFLGRNPLANQPAANAAEAATNASDAANFLNRVGNPAPSLGDPPSFITNPFNSGPSTDTIMNSSNFKALTDQGLSPDKALSLLKEEYTPSAFARFGAPALGIAALAAFSGDDEEEEEEYMETGADLYYADPDRYNINLYQNGGVVSSLEGLSRQAQDFSDQVQSVISGDGGNMNLMQTPPGSLPVAFPSFQGRPALSNFEEEKGDYLGLTTGGQRMTGDMERYRLAQEDARRQREGGFMGRVMLPGEGSFEDFMNMRPQFDLQQTSLLGAPFGSPMGFEDGGAVPNKYKGFSKLPEAVQEKIDPSLAAKYKAGGEAYPRRTGGIGPGLGSGTKDDVPALLMDGEFVMTRDAVKGAGGGSVKKGIDRMYDVMRDLENKATA